MDTHPRRVDTPAAPLAPLTIVFALRWDRVPGVVLWRDAAWFGPAPGFVTAMRAGEYTWYVARGLN
jgi:hypothetical protein